jgi:hypothetical protein
MDDYTAFATSHMLPVALHSVWLHKRLEDRRPQTVVKLACFNELNSNRLTTQNVYRKSATRCVLDCIDVASLRDCIAVSLHGVCHHMSIHLGSHLLLIILQMRSNNEASSRDDWVSSLVEHLGIIVTTEDLQKSILLRRPSC